MHPLSHHEALTLTSSLDCSERVRAALIGYIEFNASLETLGSPSAARLAGAAERRSWEAVNRVTTLSNDVSELSEVVCHQARVIAKQCAEIDDQRILLEELVRIVLTPANTLP